MREKHSTVELYDKKEEFKAGKQSASAYQSVESPQEPQLSLKYKSILEMDKPSVENNDSVTEISEENSSKKWRPHKVDEKHMTFDGSGSMHHNEQEVGSLIPPENGEIINFETNDNPEFKAYGKSTFNL